MREIRLQRVHEAVVEHGSVQVSRLAAEYDVSEETIRRDLDRLARLGLVVRTRGGAVAPGTSLTERDLQIRAQENRPEKRAIARAVVERLVKDGISIGLDTGSTTLEIARALRGRSVTVVTNSLPAINELAGTDVTLVVLGGTFQPRSMSVVGAMTERAADQLHCDLALISAPAMTAEHGPMDTDLEAIEVKRAFIRRANRSYAVVDHTKLGRTAFSTICEPTLLTGLVTDDGADPVILDAFRALGLDVITGTRTDA
ncbi:MAG TPA: DeoR/GlpR family DNA-binding transcription regulator [Candidatus Saccharimonadales bacterium]|nr:DeoR/GlpR family DNA-binding transcription regulator [Candidatus Saccharimonadales bacterium]